MGIMRSRNKMIHKATDAVDYLDKASTVYYLEKSRNERLSEELKNIKNQLISNKNAKAPFYLW